MCLPGLHLTDANSPRPLSDATAICVFCSNWETQCYSLTLMPPPKRSWHLWHLKLSASKFIRHQIILSEETSALLNFELQLSELFTGSVFLLRLLFGDIAAFAATVKSIVTHVSSSFLSISRPEASVADGQLLPLFHAANRPHILRPNLHMEIFKILLQWYLLSLDFTKFD